MRRSLEDLWTRVCSVDYTQEEVDDFTERLQTRVRKPSESPVQTSGQDARPTMPEDTRKRCGVNPELWADLLYARQVQMEGMTHWELIDWFRKAIQAGRTAGHSDDYDTVKTYEYNRGFTAGVQHEQDNAPDHRECANAYMEGRAQGQEDTTSYQRTIADMKTRIDNLEELDVTNAATIRSLRDTVAGRDAQVGELKAQAAERAQTIDQLQATIERHIIVNRGLYKDIADQQQTIEQQSATIMNNVTIVGPGWVNNIHFEGKVKYGPGVHFRGCTFAYEPTRWDRLKGWFRR